MSKEVEVKVTGEITFKFELTERGQLVELPDKPVEKLLELIKEQMMEEVDLDVLEIINSDIEIKVIELGNIEI